MNRRNLIKMLATGLALPAGLTSMQNLMATENAKQGRRLILVELSGANDGLNTLVPTGNDHYHELRPKIGLSKKQVLRLTDELSMHQSMKPLVDVFEQGEMAWVQGLGYPEPNRSHFASIAHWESGGDGLRSGRKGWITHDIEHKLGRSIADAHGISLKGGLNLFDSNGGRWMSFSSTSQIESNPSTSTTRANQSRSENSTLNLVMSKMDELNSTLSSLSKKLETTPRVANLPGGSLGAQLAQVRRLIQAGVDTPVFRVQLSGFDTHENQLNRHKRLLSQLSASTAAFRKAMIADGEWNNTLIMTYSEFGRRAAENFSGGTDHGTAAPHWVMGGQVSGGIYGTSPDLSKLVDGDPVFTSDYRSLYERVLRDWFDIQNNQFNDYKSEPLRHLFG